MFTHEPDFVSGGIKPLIDGVRKLHVLFATYNTVAGYRSGPVQTGRDGLTIQVQNGNLVYSPLTDLIWLGPHDPLGKLGAQIMDAEGRAAQKMVESSLQIETGESAEFIAVIYAGLSAFDEALAMGRKIKAERPKSKVVIVTCDCAIERKAQTLNPLLQNKEIEAVVVTNTCGGRQTMRSILDGVMSQWPVTPVSV